MSNKTSLRLLAVAGLMCLITQSAIASNSMSVTWTDIAGDPGPVGDVVSAQLSFDSSGSWTAKWYAATDHPFTGNARFNLNLFDTTLGDVTKATTSQVNLDELHDFGTSKATFFSYSGRDPFLSNWHVGDQVTSGNILTFMSGAVDMNTPYHRDNLLSTGTIIAVVPELQTYAMLLAGLALMGGIARRRKGKLA